nr:bifunctional demethylmenaquinone methyltransferase/2-methoxy-6-polyprenyl-1,4-benzoquinol methylase UbiE [Candidatus Omnitrophota bacterium]MBI5025044.1 bifunctional demethylmenaquinone methyltransferase/2-methoxy-6-polyprenyl-1,4-benzoquinol methylase UbiE [Candidatus Omnitrophota bacterium]
MPRTNDNFAIPKSDSWRMFDEISPRYDLLNRLLSLGLDVFWRRQLVRFLPARTGRDLSLLDLATGTADVPLTLVRRGKNIEYAVGIDLADKMLAIGREKVTRAKLEDKILLSHGDASHIAFNADVFNVVTMAFGIRNVADPLRVLREMRRVLKPRGRALILEFSLPENSTLRAPHLFYLRAVVPTIGGLISGHGEAYRYLNQTIEQFPCGAAFCAIMADAGFHNVTAHPLLGGIATIYAGEK